MSWRRRLRRFGYWLEDDIAAPVIYFVRRALGFKD